MDANATTTGGNTGTGPVIALSKGKTGIYASFNGTKPKLFNPQGELNEQTLLSRLLSTARRSVTIRVLIIGTRNDGTPGWDEIDATTMAEMLPANIAVTYLSEAEALHGSLAKDGEVCAYLIFATTKPGDDIHGSVRWWVQDGNTVRCVDVCYVDRNYGQVFTMAGGSFMGNPAMAAGLTESLLAHYPKVTRVYVWSQDGMADLPAYEKGGQFRVTFRAPEWFIRNGGVVVTVPTATDMIALASASEVHGQNTTTDTQDAPSDPPPVDPALNGATTKKTSDA